MNNKTYTITLADGTVLSDLKLNGNNYISKVPIEESVFATENLTTVIVDDGEYPITYRNMEFVQTMNGPEEWWFILIPIPQEEMERRKLWATLDYLAMMSNVEL